MTSTNPGEGVMRWKGEGKKEPSEELQRIMGIENCIPFKEPSVTLHFQQK